MHSSSAVIVVGSFAVGMTIRAPRMPVMGETLIGRDFDLGPGGKGSNQAIAASRLGAASFFVGAVGSDSYGNMAVDLFRAEGVDATNLIVDETAPTGVGVILLDELGNNCIIVDPGANSTLSMDRLPLHATAFDGADVVAAVLEISLESAIDALRIGKSYGATTILNPAPVPPGGIPTEAWAVVDIVTPNESELRLLLGLEPDDMSTSEDLGRAFFALSNSTVVVTLGERGALIIDDEGTTHVSSPSVDVVDSTGAGDAFNAALAVCVAEGQDVVSAVQFACCAGAYACMALGVVPSLGRRCEIGELFALMYD